MFCSHSPNDMKTLEQLGSFDADKVIELNECMVNGSNFENFPFSHSKSWCITGCRFPKLVIAKIAVLLL